MPEILKWITGERTGALPNVGFSTAQLVGTIGGGNATFLLQPAPVNGVQIFHNGILFSEGAQGVGQYTRTSTGVVFNPEAVPQQGDIMQVFVW